MYVICFKIENGKMIDFVVELIFFGKNTSSDNTSFHNYRNKNTHNFVYRNNWPC